MTDAPPLVVWTVGHSSRPLDEFLDLLEAEGIQVLADVRRYPGSRAHPHFNPEPLERALVARQMAYLPFPALGGRRAPDPHSVNTIWRNAAFRGYADYMQTAEFAGGLARLEALARQKCTAIMCSEAVWWRCHRSLIADALKVSGARVLHIMGRGKASEHPYTAAATVRHGRLTYGPAPT